MKKLSNTEAKLKKSVAYKKASIMYALTFSHLEGIRENVKSKVNLGPYQTSIMKRFPKIDNF